FRDEALDGLRRLVRAQRERERSALGELDGGLRWFGRCRSSSRRGDATICSPSTITAYRQRPDAKFSGPARDAGPASRTSRAPRPVRFFYYEPMFRGQRPQLLRYRQFWQWGLECFGPEEPLADVEIVDFTVRLFSEVGLRNYELELNTVGDAKCQPKVKAALAEYFAKNRDALSDESKGRLERNPMRILDSKDPKDRAIVAAAPAMHELLCAEDRE